MLNNNPSNHERTACNLARMAGDKPNGYSLDVSVWALWRVCGVTWIHLQVKGFAFSWLSDFYTLLNSSLALFCYFSYGNRCCVLLRL